MPCYPDHNQILNAGHRTWEAFGMNENALLNSDEASVFLKYLLLEGLEYAEIRFWRMRLRNDDCKSLRRRLMQQLRKIQSAIRFNEKLTALKGIEWHVLDHFIVSSPSYQQRLIDLALEALLSEPLAPELCVTFSPSPQYIISASLQGIWNHAIIFAEPVFFTHEYYPLVADAFVHDSKVFGRPRTNVLGAHMDWFTEHGKLTRIIYFDFASGRLIETDLDVPIQANSIQFLCLGGQERERHRIISHRFNGTQVNPALVSSLADDKAATLAGWSGLDLEIPAYQEIAAGDIATAFRFLNSFSEIVIKPNQATESEYVAFFRRGQAKDNAVFKHHLHACWERGTVIAQQRRDGVCVRDPVSNEYHTVALRLNIAFDGTRHCLESAFAQLGQDDKSPAACGRGGRIIAVDEILTLLTSRHSAEGKPICLNTKDWHRIREQAEHAASLFKGLLLIGLDVLLDHDEQGHVIPVFLEANPRPSGLSHSRLMADDPHLQAQIGVSLKLWDCLT
jgi:hypothetical protein